MERRITGFHRDGIGDWVAELDCHHNQHVRHKPPFFNRPWTETPAGRDGMLGAVLDCLRCDRLEFPEGLEEYKRTPEFSEADIPTGLLRDHNTRGGVWGRIRVLEGRLFYTVHYPEQRRLELGAGESGVVVPGMKHHVRAADRVRFHVAFFRKPDAGKE